MIGIFGLFWFWETPLFAPICRFVQRSTKNLSLFQLFQPQPPILSPPSSNLIPIGYALNAGKWRVWRKFRGKPPFLCHHPPACQTPVSKKSTLTKKKNRRRPNSKGDTLSRFQITALPLLFNTLKNVFVPSLLYTYCIPLLCWCIIKVYFFGKRLLCNWVYLAKNPATPPHKGRG